MCINHYVEFTMSSNVAQQQVVVEIEDEKAKTLLLELIKAKKEQLQNCTKEEEGR
jgi:hypothetical protein